MTPRDHNKALGIMHLIYGGFQTLVLLVFCLVMLMFAGILSSLPAEPGMPPTGVFVAIGAALLVFYTVLAVPSLVAGYALLRGKAWARVAGVVSAIFAALSFPFGTALCVYSLWFFFGEAGKRFYERDAFSEAARGQLGGSSYEASAHGWEAQRNPRDRGTRRAAGDWDDARTRVSYRDAARRADGDEAERTREAPYTPPAQPPDWRGQ